MKTKIFQYFDSYKDGVPQPYKEELEIYIGDKTFRCSSFRPGTAKKFAREHLQSRPKIQLIDTFDEGFK